jgi:hypothetical protein
MNPAEARPSSFGERHAGLLACLAMLHLVLVGMFVWTNVSETSDSAVHRTLRTYRNLSGIFRDYRFFAPGVASDMRAGFFLERPDGTSEFQAFLSDNLEVGFRYNCIIGASMRSEALRDLMAQSWAAVMLGNHPDASHVTVVAQSFELPTMRAYAAGKRPHWRVVYAGKFDRRQRAATEPAATAAAAAAAATAAAMEVAP